MPTPSPSHTLLFTGHMIDRPDRDTPRFPPDQEDVARVAIRDAVRREQARAGMPLRGVAGGACGGDILFHEVCQEHAISSAMYLALPHEQYLESSVAFAGPDWVRRFDWLYNALPVYLLPNADLSDPTIWVRANLWMLEAALIHGSRHMTLIALWNGSSGDRPGGTENLVRRAASRGVETIILDTNELFGLKRET